MPISVERPLNLTRFILVLFCSALVSCTSYTSIKAMNPNSKAIDREVEIYNIIIKLTSKKYGIDSSEIWYKSHPRLSYEDWEFKKKNLHCSTYSYQHNTIAEVELLNKNLRAVYSLNSTTLFYAKKIFDLDSYLIDIRDEDCHPSAYKKAYYLANQFDITTIHI